MSSCETDFFHYPEANSCAGIRSRVDLPDPSLWRHSFAVIYKTRGQTMRLVAKGLEFPGRCFHCKHNNKPMCFCFLGQGARDGRNAADLPPQVVSKLNKITMICEVRASEGRAFASDLGDSKAFVFPHDSEYEDSKSVVSLQRVSTEHGFPPLVALLCQPRPWKFRDYFPSTLFDEFLTKRVRLVYGATKHSRKSVRVEWTEPAEEHEERLRLFSELPTDDLERRRAVADLMYRTYLVFKYLACDERCVVPSKDCAGCKRVRGVAKKHYLSEVTRIVFEHVGGMFEARKGPFAKCPVDLRQRCYEDEACQVYKLAVESSK